MNTCCVLAFIDSGDSVTFCVVVVLDNFYRFQNLTVSIAFIYTEIIQNLQNHHGTSASQAWLLNQLAIAV